MTVSTRQVARHFNKRARTYDDHAAVQHAMARLSAAELAARVLPAADVLEIGCGTGELTALLLERLPETRILAVDIAEEMVRRARRRVGEQAAVDFAVGDAEELAFEGCFDAVISSAAVQWLRRPVATMATLARTLVPGGVMVHTTFGPRTFSQFFSLLARVEAERGSPPSQHRLPLMDAAEWEEALRVAPLSAVEVSSRVIEERFPSARAWLQTLRGTGAAINSGAPADVASLRTAMQRYDREQASGDGVVVCYEILTLVASRPGPGPSKEVLVG